MKIKISNIINDSIVDGPGIRLAVFTQGCIHNCKGCHNPQTHDISGGQPVDMKYIIEMVNKNPLLDGVTITGGEPFLQSKELSSLAKEIKKLGLNVMVYTGYTWEELMRSYEVHESFLKEIDVLVDGRFMPELRSLDLKYRGSSNQRIIDVKKTLKAKQVCKLEL
ncbi:anaerobic ribonucleoside-triphosphate reductase activating protein [Clostridium sp. UBA4548]|uniref:anaerobic ribonucleoside-triphosphate reductase activating protein n=1 Tax=Clostridium sp. UBA4548 TaxID=1946361 RepID=UPI0025C57913|nr:anaerobic ribonucleoside-triphosphate reductase activating protein [Clostridium sp. UBA4548]